MAFIEPCFGIGHNLSLICQMTSEDIKHQLIIITVRQLIPLYFGHCPPTHTFIFWSLSANSPLHHFVTVRHFIPTSFGPCPSPHPLDCCPSRHHSMSSLLPLLAVWTLGRAVPATRFLPLLAVRTRDTTVNVMDLYTGI